LRPQAPKRAATPVGIRLAALGGVVGPAAFIGGWTIGNVVTSRAYSPVHDAISRLAELGADTRPLMTTGFIGFGIGLPIYAYALRRTVAGTAWMTAAMTGVATLAVAASPLARSARFDTWHAAFATIGYVSLAATPLLAARHLRRDGHRGLARFGVLAGAVSAVALALTATGLPTGLFERIGLTTADAWIVTSALTIATARSASHRNQQTGL
jgi:hypothetical membrane protein